jgi:membrane protein DedA with SNARE-associated domain
MLAHLHSLSAIEHYLLSITYAKAFIVIVASGHVIPIPESVTLLLLGYATSASALKLSGVMGMAVLATLVIDLFIYAICLGGSEIATHLSKKIKAELLNRYTNAEEKHLFGLVFASHFIPGWRFANPVIAGVTQMPWKKFTLYSAISSLIYAPLYVFIGFHFHTQILSVINTILSIHHLVLDILIVAVVTLIVVYNMRHAKE